jgi:hypothetical protein
VFSLFFFKEKTVRGTYTWSKFHFCHRNLMLKNMETKEFTGFTKYRTVLKGSSHVLELNMVIDECFLVSITFELLNNWISGLWHSFERSL